MNRFDWICYSKPPRTWRSWWELSSSQSTTLKIAEKESVSVFGACAQAQSAEMLAAQPPTSDCSAVRAFKSQLQRRFVAPNPVPHSFCVGEQPRWLWLLRCYSAEPPYRVKTMMETGQKWQANMTRLTLSTSCCQAKMRNLKHFFVVLFCCSHFTSVLNQKLLIIYAEYCWWGWFTKFLTST